MLKTLRFLMIAIMLLLAAAVAALFWARSNGLLPGRDNQFDANQGTASLWGTLLARQPHGRPHYRRGHEGEAGGCFFWLHQLP